MNKGRPTAEYTVTTNVVDGKLTIIVEAFGASADDVQFTQVANGTVELGKTVAELGKYVSPKTAAEVKLEANIAMLVKAGLSESAAIEAARNLR